MYSPVNSIYILQRSSLIQLIAMNNDCVDNRLGRCRKHRAPSEVSTEVSMFGQWLLLSSIRQVDAQLLSKPVHICA